jgi:predicted RNase H-like nuclease (RuvC/YqgF family)
MQKKCQEMEENGTTEVQQYQEANMELESELEHLEAELERMRMYETSYHT